MKPLVLISATTMFAYMPARKVLHYSQKARIIIISYKDSFEIHIESKMNRCPPRICHWQMVGLALRLHIIYVQV